MSAPELYYWEKMSSPHKAGLLEALTRHGYKVTYVVEATITPDRLSQGWSVPSFQGVRLEIISTINDVERLIKLASSQAIHICDGIRSNGMVVFARAALKRHGLRFWVFMETVDDHGWRGLIKKLEYRRLFWLWRNQLAGILSVGLNTTQWIVNRGVPEDKVFPFAYFLAVPSIIKSLNSTKKQLFHFVYVGQLIERKRIDLLIDALVPLIDKVDFNLIIIGTGPLNDVLQAQADQYLKGRVKWIGKLPLEDVASAMARADCLVLPSRHDGWGAVVSEALMVGTPVICSDHCGAAIAVKANDRGGIFINGDVNSLTMQLNKVISAGPISPDMRKQLSEWARCLGADAGAVYFLNILKHKAGQPKPLAPWSLNDFFSLVQEEVQLPNIPSNISK